MSITSPYRAITVRCEVVALDRAYRALRAFEPMLTNKLFDEQTRELMVMADFTDIPREQIDRQVEVILAALEEAGCHRIGARLEGS